MPFVRPDVQNILNLLAAQPGPPRDVVAVGAARVRADLDEATRPAVGGRERVEPREAAPPVVDARAARARLGRVGVADDPGGRRRLRGGRGQRGGAEQEQADA
jgi:hypothetical protein